ncbi:uncharacterized protein LOC131026817 isoform X2 [Cryptomeria japonica]|uniref:uncharacterized protein LOC131026817 isoform X2 n=1 Tax=Cryptomeria japonica TaxID=3369 RepID=UPI0027DA5165|nr:uncharacterized protein LOC131026817 isoform X2 [Cryptomeria japonica]
MTSNELWHKRFAHLNFRTLSSLEKMVIGLLKLNQYHDGVCKGCALERDPNLEPDSLEQRDPKYDVMLNELLGRVKTKSGGVAEMGEASIAPRVNRPLPKLRKTSDIIGTGREKILAPGKLNVSQLRQILLLHKGEAENQEQPMDAKDIAEKFQLDVLIVQKILHHVSLPTESFGAEDKSN